MLLKIELSWFWCYRLYITYTPYGISIGLDQKSNVCRDIDKIEGLMRCCLPIPQKLHNVIKRLKTAEEVEEYILGLLAFVDCTEQPIYIPRPAKNRLRQTYYSGKRKKHTHGKEPVHSKSEGDDNPQIQTQTKRY
ncbi:hypothetical protein BH23THE1_BH23THE1_13310 [soil metagenome]